MKKIKDVISQMVTSKPDVIQFAKDRKFEESWIITLVSTKPTEQDINNYLLKEKFEILIVEYVWNSNDDNKRFVITIFLDKNCKLQDPKKFVNISLDIFYHYSDFLTLIKIFDTRIIGNEYLLVNPVESVNLSVFNHWLSVGPVDLWKSGDFYNIDSITEMIKARPEIEKTKLNYQGLLFRFNINGNFNGPYYGIKTPCCDRLGDSWLINYEKVGYWIEKMIGVN